MVRSLLKYLSVRRLTSRKIISIAFLSEYSPKLNLTVKNTLSEDGGEDSIQLTFQSMKDFTPEQVAAQIPQLKAMLAMRNLLRDLKANLLDNQTFRKELEKIVLDQSLSAELRNELSALASENRNHHAVLTDLSRNAHVCTK